MLVMRPDVAGEDHERAEPKLEEKECGKENAPVRQGGFSCP
jgi:hypothetical protein